MDNLFNKGEKIVNLRSIHWSSTLFIRIQKENVELLTNFDVLPFKNKHGVLEGFSTMWLFYFVLHIYASRIKLISD